MPRYIDHLNNPNIPLYKVLAMTSAIVGVFKPVRWEGKTFFDGGILDNYPITCFPPQETLGIRLGIVDNVLFMIYLMMVSI
jgi:predicted acylesterase/phospholipase RssA